MTDQTNLSRITKNIYRLARNLKFIGIVRRSVVLRSIPKSGTNYLRLLISNYVHNIPVVETGGPKFSRVSYTQMQDSLFPNTRDLVFTGKRAYARPNLENAELFGRKYADFMYDHGSNLDLMRIFRPKKLILLYRNPFDQLVSTFFYSWKNRPGREDEFSHPSQIIDRTVPSFIRSYSEMRDLHYRARKSRTLLLSYESLFLQPVATLGSVLEFLELPVYPELVCLSVEASSINKTREEESQLGGAIHAPAAGLVGSFARSGQVGQWRRYLTSDDFAKIQELLEKAGIDYRVFWLDAQDGGIPGSHSAAIDAGK